MNYFVTFIEGLSDKFALLFAGFLGSLMTVVADGSISWKKALILVPSGAVAAGYLTPLVAWYTRLDPEFESSLGFLVGLFSMHLLKVILGFVNALARDPRSLVSILLGFLKPRK